MARFGRRAAVFTAEDTGRDEAASASEDVWISVCGVSKRYTVRDASDVLALEDINFTVKKGEFITIVGPSGCGKTTLLKILAGLIPASAGRIDVAGNEVRSPVPEIGMVFQDATLLPWRKIIDNVMLPVEVQGLPRKKYKERASELLESVGLAGFADAYPSELSGGMQQRAGICRALVHDPAVMLMDEPFGALDAMTREYMNTELLRIWEQSRKTVALVTHSITEAVYLADRVVVMSARPGRIAEIVEIHVPRPRPLSVMTSGIAGDYVQRIRQHFDQAGAIE